MLKKGKWSKEEDDLIINHIQRHGNIGRSWQALSDSLGLKRCGRSCRSRWLNYLRPGLKHGNFTPAEERIICEMYRKRGSCWSVIAAQLPGRTDLAIKNYWNSTLKKKYLLLPAARTAANCRRRQTCPAGSTSSSSGAGVPAPARGLELVLYSSEESSTAGSSSSSVKPVLPGPTPVPVASAGQEPTAAAVPVGGPVAGIEQKPALLTLLPPPPPPPAGDQIGERPMDIVCAPLSPIPLSFMEPELPLACMYGFDDTDSFLPWFDHH